MDARVNDFLHEIDEISPLGKKKEENVWEKCLDEDSGYHYYWNTKTDEVTWDMPHGFVPSAKSKPRKNNLFIPPRSAPLFPISSTLLPADSIKIYKLGKPTNKDDSKLPETVQGNVEPKSLTTQQETGKKALIASYGGDSESEEEKPQAIKTVNGSTNSDEDEDTSEDLLATMHKKAAEVNLQLQTQKKGSSAFSLVVGYSDSEESESESQPEEATSCSTLFPVVKPISLNDFVPKSSEGEDFNSKAFQRKRRIGVALVNAKKKRDGDEERKGLGFTASTEDSSTGSLYPSFKSGGVMFCKGETLNSNVEGKADNAREIEETYDTLKEKLHFLSEGRDEVSPVQIMMIQIETLYTALKSGSLEQQYLKRWLDDTCSDLIKLEKETTPEGWLLQWDRSHKRYYYQNMASGESQWEYPEADVTVCDEAMDICTTPPPNGTESTIHMSPPLPPAIGSPSPPPPPVISGLRSKKKKHDIPLPPEPEVFEKYDNEPLPPGVDSPEIIPKEKANMNEVLSSFYSDIAAIETSDSPPQLHLEDVPADSSLDQPKKKKKAKVKLAQGIAMKKKGVSKMVEKWKNVQLSYNE